MKWGEEYDRTDSAYFETESLGGYWGFAGDWGIESGGKAVFLSLEIRSMDVFCPCTADSREDTGYSTGMGAEDSGFCTAGGGRGCRR